MYQHAPNICTYVSWSFKKRECEININCELSQDPIHIGEQPTVTCVRVIVL